MLGLRGCLIRNREGFADRGASTTRGLPLLPPSRTGTGADAGLTSPSPSECTTSTTGSAPAFPSSSNFNRRSSAKLSPYAASFALSGERPASAPTPPPPTPLRSPSSSSDSPHSISNIDCCARCTHASACAWDEIARMSISVGTCGRRVPSVEIGRAHV